MPWNTLASTDVTAEILPDEITVLNAVQGSTAILPTILATCLAEIQASILVGGNQIGPVGSIPDQIRSDAIAFVRWKWFCSLPKTDLQSDFRKAQYEEAVRRFGRIREGEERTEIPTAPQNTVGPSNRSEIARPGTRVGECGWSKLGET